MLEPGRLIGVRNLPAPYGPKELRMDFEKFTDRARGFVQSAQSLALREGHQQFSTEHLLKVLLDDPEGLATGLIDRSGGKSREALRDVEASLSKRPKVSGPGRVKSIWIRRSPVYSTRPKKLARKLATVSLPSSDYCWRSHWRKTVTPERSSPRPA
jgi:ATPases with chaperone activity, ATP-binding subunit